VHSFGGRLSPSTGPNVVDVALRRRASRRPRATHCVGRGRIGGAHCRHAALCVTVRSVAGQRSLNLRLIGGTFPMCARTGSHVPGPGAGCGRVSTSQDPGSGVGRTARDRVRLPELRTTRDANRRGGAQFKPTRLVARGPSVASPVGEGENSRSHPQSVVRPRGLRSARDGVPRSSPARAKVAPSRPCRLTRTGELRW